MVFVAGVSFGESAKAIPIAAIVGLLCGLIVGAAIYMSSRRVSKSFSVVCTEH